jgi:predicted Zn finger-like uncharacterized protein
MLIIQCPSCSRELRVPDELLGRTVRCPTCKGTFTAGQGEQPTGSRPTENEDEPPQRERRRPAPPSRDEDYEKAARPLRSRPAPPPEDDDDHSQSFDDEDDAYEERPRPRRRGRRRAAARGAVAGPAISLMVVSGLVLTFYAVALVLNLVGVALLPALAGQPGAPGRPNQGQAAAQLVGNVAGLIIGVCWWSIVFLGALKMNKLQGYGYAMTATIMSIFPCIPCCVLSLPFGIWALVVLLRPDVKEAF